MPVRQERQPHGAGETIQATKLRASWATGKRDLTQFLVPSSQHAQQLRHMTHHDDG